MNYKFLIVPAILLVGSLKAMGQTYPDGTPTFAQPVEITDAESGTQTVSNGTGSFTEKNDAGTWAKKWQSSASPAVTLSCGSNNMAMTAAANSDVSSDAIIVAVGGNSATSCPYTLAVPSGYVITEYSFDAQLTSSAASASIQLAVGSDSKTLTSTAQSFQATGLSAQSLTAFTLSGDNKGVKITRFSVKYQKSTVATTGSIGINTATGSFTAKNDGNTWASAWASSATQPQLTLQCTGPDNGSTNYAARNNMDIKNSSSSALVAYTGKFTPCRYTLSLTSGWFITGYSMKVALVDASKPVTFTDAKGNAVSLSTTPVEVKVDGLSLSSLTAFTLTGENYGIKITDWTVSYRLAKQTIFDNASSTIPYRIPAIGKAGNGDIIAVADYRYSTGDIGTGKLDLRLRRSSDNGKTWTPILAYETFKGDGKNEAGSDFPSGGDASNGRHDKCAYGDPCIVGDRESARMMITACSGYPGFGQGTNTYHQGWARWYSYDNGKTWSEPAYLDEKYFYEPLRKAGRSDIKGFFIGSGKIHQSRYIKRGNYYRLYCVGVSQHYSGTNNNNSMHENWVFYSDDFGETWNILGGKPGISTVCDEPKAEELPDGSVLLSSRVANGRKYAIYTFAEPNDGVTGSWGEPVFTNFTVNGSSVVDNFGTNGEIGVLPVVRKSDNQKMYLAVQSLPTNSRTNVKIFYKALDSESKYNSATAFANNWDGSYQISSTSSSYSTFCVQADHNLGWLYEENSHNHGFDIQYQNLSIETITGDAYTYDTSYECKAKQIDWDLYGRRQQLAELIDSAQAAYDANEEYTKSDEKLLVAASQLQCQFGCKEYAEAHPSESYNYKTNDCYDISVLLDNDASTYYHTLWQKGSVSLGSHYMDIDAAEGKNFHGTIFVDVTRRQVATGHITKFTIHGSNDGVNYTGIAEIDIPNATNGATGEACFTIPEGTTYSKLRFSVTGTDNGEGYWCMSEFQLYQGELTGNNVDYGTEAQALVSALATARTITAPETTDVQRLYDAYAAYANSVFVYTLDETKTDNVVVLRDLAKVSLVRTLVGNGVWNTFCVPFNLSAEQIAEKFGTGTELCTFGSMEGTTMNFEPADAIEAGKPYIIKLGSTTDVADPEFESVKVAAAEPVDVGSDGYVMRGIFNASDLATDGTNLFLASGNKLKAPNASANHMKGMRVFFVLPSDKAQLGMQANIGGEETSIDNIHGLQVVERGAVYSIDGKKLGYDLDRLGKGVYVVDGKKVVK